MDSLGNWVNREIDLSGLDQPQEKKMDNRSKRNIKEQLEEANEILRNRVEKCSSATGHEMDCPR